MASFPEIGSETGRARRMRVLNSGIGVTNRADCYFETLPSAVGSPDPDDVVGRRAPLAGGRTAAREHLAARAGAPVSLGRPS